MERRNNVLSTLSLLIYMHGRFIVLFYIIIFYFSNQIYFIFSFIFLLYINIVLYIEIFFNLYFLDIQNTKKYFDNELKPNFEK